MTVVDQALLIVEEVPPVSKGRCNFEVNTARRSRWPNFWQGLKTLWRAVGIGDSTGLPVGQSRPRLGRIQALAADGRLTTGSHTTIFSTFQLALTACPTRLHLHNVLAVHEGAAAVEVSTLTTVITVKILHRDKSLTAE